MGKKNRKVQAKGNGTNEAPKNAKEIAKAIFKRDAKLGKNITVGKKMKKGNNMSSKERRLFSTEENISFVGEDKVSLIEKKHLEKQKLKKEDDKQDKHNLKLPVKDSQGKLIKASELEVESDNEDNVDKEEKQDNDNVEGDEMYFSDGNESELEFEEEQEKSEKSHINSVEYISEKLEILASTAQNIMSSPEENYTNFKTLKVLSMDGNLKVRKFALLSMLNTFKDVLPSYRIRNLTEAEKQMKVSKEIRKQRAFEEALVSNYQAYINLLINTFKKATLKPAVYTGFKSLIIKCLTELMVYKRGFNFEEDIINFIAKKMSTTKEDEELEMCLKASIELFQQDELGHSSLKLIQSILKCIKHKQYKISPKLIRIFLFLKLNDSIINNKEENKNNKNNKNNKEERKRKLIIDKKLLDERKEHLSKKRKKRIKAQKEVEREMQEAEAEYSIEQKSQVQSEILKCIFIIYFRILKEAPSTKLFPVILEGLSKFGHLISVDFFSDLLAVLKNILKEGLNSKHNDNFIHSNYEVIKCKLLCILTAFKLLSGQGQALNLDLTEFYNYMYELLIEVALLPNEDNTNNDDNEIKKDQFNSRNVYNIVIDCLDALFFRSSQVPLVRAAAFLKRISTVAFHFPQPYAMKLINMSKAFLIKYPGLDRMLSSEDIAGDGQFFPLVKEPERSNPFSTHLFELPALLNSYYDPKLQQVALDAIKVASIRQ